MLVGVMAATLAMADSGDTTENSDKDHSNSELWNGLLVCGIVPGMLAISGVGMGVLYEQGGFESESDDEDDDQLTAQLPLLQVEHVKQP
jgi:hypothetical protein